MFDKVRDGFKVFQLGQEVANPAKWKARQINANKIGMLLLALIAMGRSFGYDMHIDDDTVALVAGGLYGVGNWLFTLATSKTVGIGPNGGTLKAARPSGDGAASGDAQPTAPVGSSPAYPVAPDSVRPVTEADREAP